MARVVAGDEDVLCGCGQFTIHDHGVDAGCVGFFDNFLQGSRVVRQNDQRVDVLDHQILDIAHLLGARTRGDHIELDVFILRGNLIDRFVRPPQQARCPTVVRRRHAHADLVLGRVRQAGKGNQH